MNDRNNFIVSSWMSRRSPPPPIAPDIIKPIGTVPADRPVGRHSVIRTQLPNWHSYRSWVDKVRGSWDEKKQR
jgi:hypothetical protein